MMPNINPFARRTTIPYHRVSKEFTQHEDGRSPTDTRPSTLPDEIDNLIADQARRRTRRKHAFCYAFVCFVSLLTGSILSQFFFRLEVEIDGYPAPFGHTTHLLKDVVWHRNETFQAPPSPESEKAWMALMPKGRGSVRYPKDSPVEKGITVFHGVHCLYNLHTAFHANSYLLAKSKHETSAPQTPRFQPPTPPLLPPIPRSPTNEGQTHDHDHDHPHIPAFTLNPYLETRLRSPDFTAFLESPHLAHCFDYLRQSLMCAADSNLEEGVVRSGGEGEGGVKGKAGWEHVDVTGWGVKRTCRDFEAVRAWVEEWRGEEGVGLN